jgi:hypothetical protein
MCNVLGLAQDCSALARALPPTRAAVAEIRRGKQTTEQGP